MEITLLMFAGVALVLVVGAVVIGRQAWQSQRQVMLARRWPRVVGTVVASGVREELVRLPANVAAGERVVSVYTPEVVYRYVVNGREYQSSRLSIGTELRRGRSEAALQAARYPAGASVTVYVNPNDPTDTALDARITTGMILLWLTVPALLVVALFFVKLTLDLWARG